MERRERGRWQLHDPETELELVKRDLMEGELGLCRLVIDSMFYCTTPRHQIRTYYLDGRFDSCKIFSEAMQYCAKQAVQGARAAPWREDMTAQEEDIKVKPPWKFKERYYELNREKIQRRYDLGDDAEGTGGAPNEASTP